MANSNVSYDPSVNALDASFISFFLSDLNFDASAGIFTIEDVPVVIDSSFDAIANGTLPIGEIYDLFRYVTNDVENTAIDKLQNAAVYLSFLVDASNAFAVSDLSNATITDFVNDNRNTDIPNCANTYLDLKKVDISKDTLSVPHGYLGYVASRIFNTYLGAGLFTPTSIASGINALNNDITDGLKHASTAQLVSIADAYKYIPTVELHDPSGNLAINGLAKTHTLYEARYGDDLTTHPSLPQRILETMMHQDPDRFHITNILKLESSHVTSSDGSRPFLTSDVSTYDNSDVGYFVFKFPWLVNDTICFNVKIYADVNQHSTLVTNGETCTIPPYVVQYRLKLI